MRGLWSGCRRSPRRNFNGFAFGSRITPGPVVGSPQGCYPGSRFRKGRPVGPGAVPIMGPTLCNVKHFYTVFGRSGIIYERITMGGEGGE